jgi:hypothetical protein
MSRSIYGGDVRPKGERREAATGATDCSPDGGER